jgi:hypothetical protein
MSVTPRTLGPLHFEDLEPHRFEDLVRQLIYDFRAWRALEATGRAGSDEGFDARGFEVIDLADDPIAENDIDDETPAQAGDDRLWLIQCKREKTITPAKLKKHLGDIPDTSTKGLHGVLFVAACDFSKATRDAFRTWCREKGIAEAHMWGKAELEDQLYQPKNDGLLFAYFGFSLRIRRRSVRTALRAKLAMKRKCERILEGKSYQEILLRDPEDGRYPYPPDDDEEKTNPARWKVRQFLELHPWGVVVLVRRFPAYLAEDEKGWDVVEEVSSGGDNDHTNPWRKKRDDPEAEQREHRIWTFWRALPEARRAWLLETMLIRFEDIHDIDAAGDDVAEYPHLFVSMDIPIVRYRYLESMSRYSRTKVDPDEQTRIKFFPVDFPEVPASDNTVPD